MTNIVSSSTSISGTSDADLIVGIGSGAASTIDAGDGNDAVIGDQGPVFVGAAGTSLANATSIDTAAAWSTGSNPLVGDDTIPHATVIGSGAGSVAYYSVTVAAGATVTVDLDFGSGGYGGPTWDSIVQLLDAGGNQLSQNDDAGTGLGGLGSLPYIPGAAVSRDSYVSYTNNTANAATYYIAVSAYAQGGSNGVPTGDNYLLNVSAGGHAATGAVTLQDETINGDSGNDYLVGNGGNDVLNGGADDDILYGLVGYDTLNGGDGDDQLYGVSNQPYSGGLQYVDYLDGGAGNDLLDGGSPVAWALYTDATAGVTVSLAISGAQNTVGAGMDTLIDIGRLEGSAFADTLTGNDGDNFLQGDGGDDTLSGGIGDDTFIIGSGEGHDTLDGGNGNDTLNLGGSALGWTIDETAGTATDGTDTASLASVENVYASYHDDTIRLSSGDRRVLALGGNDVVHVAGGGTGNIDGGDGNDTIVIAGGTNTIIGGIGFDYASYADAAASVAVSLATATAQSTGVSTDTISGVEGLIGSAFDDGLTGDGSANSLIGGGGNDQIDGGAGNDTIVWARGDGSDTINGGNDVDTLDLTGAPTGWTVDLSSGTATNGADTLTLSNVESVNGTAYADTLYAGDDVDGAVSGLGGDDHIYAGGSFSVLDGGTGTDTVDVSRFNIAYAVNLATGETTFTSSGEHFYNFENYNGSNAADTVTGTVGANRINTGGGDDTVHAGGGSDTIDAGTGTNMIDGEAGTDTVSYADAASGVTVSLAITTAQNTGVSTDTIANVENVTGSDFADILTGTGGNNYLRGGVGNDVITGGAGDDIIDGGAGYDFASYADAGAGVTIDLSLAASQATGGSGSDKLVSIENVSGSNFADVLTGNSVNNELDGGGGNDKLIGGAGNDVLNGGAGTDKADYSTATLAVHVDLSITTAQNTHVGLDTLIAVENVLGSAYDDTLTGSSGTNVLSGGNGVDRLDGGLGKDTLTGGAGNDRFYFTTTLGSTNIDTISDFTVGQDVIYLDHNVFAGLAAGALPSGAFYAGTAAHDADDRIIYNSATGALSFDRDGNGSTYAAVQFATVATGLSLGASSFHVA